jgi:glycosyltransferase involved in cell wall biosynthesis
MRIGYFIRTYVGRDREGKPGFSGGIKIVSQHVKILNEMGYETLLITKNLPADLNLADLNLYEKPIIVKTDDDIPECDIYVGTLYSDVKMLFQRGKGKVVHLCQGYEPVDFISRIKGETVTEKYIRKGVLFLYKYIDVLKFKKKIKRIESIYALPTIKAAVSRHLVELIERRFHQKCFLIQNGIDLSVFYPNEGRVWGENGRIRILSVGPMQVGFKGIPDTLRSIKILKDRGIRLEFTRVSPHPPSEEEVVVGKVVDHYHMNLMEKEMAALYRNTDIFISSSLEGEGFGLPAMEALASGVPSILTEISSYKNFDTQRDFAYFVPTHRPDRIAEGILILIEDRGLRERYRDGGIRVAKGFTLERTKQDLLNFIEGLN